MQSIRLQPVAAWRWKDRARRPVSVASAGAVSAVAGRARRGYVRVWRVAVAVLAACGALLGLALPAPAQTDVPANWSLVPAGLEEGDQFRLLFVTSRTRSATSTDIAAYDGFVRGVVAGSGHRDIRRYSSRFKVLGSTATVNARNHTGTTGTGVPIYWLNGDLLPGGGKVADNYGDFYDGSWDNIDVLAGTAGHTNRPGSRYTREDGSSRLLGAGTGLLVRTGTYRDGTKWDTAVHSAGPALDVGPLGSDFPAVAAPVPRGLTSASTHASHPIGTYHISFRKDVTMQFYGLSSVFRVVAPDEPPLAPVAVTVAFEPPTSLRVSWEAPDNSGRPAITDYDVRYRVAGSDTYRDAAHDGTGLSTTLTNLIANTIYEVQVRASNDEGAGPWSPAVRGSTVANQAPSGQPTIMGRAQVWDTLRADVDSIMDGDGMERARFDFQWLAGEAAIAGATRVRYTLMPAEQGKRITLRVGFTDDNGHRETLTSAATAAVAAADPALAGDLRLRDGAADSSGRLEVYLDGRWGDVCDDGFGAEEGAVACRQLGYSGFAKLMLAPEYGSGVFLMDDVVCTGSENRLIDCRYASEANCHWYEAVGLSCLTGGNRVPSGEPTITGTLRVGQTLSADTSSIADADGPESPSFSYQWLADEEEIAGATGATYTLTAAEQGKVIKVRVSFTDGGGNEETLTSAATAAVAAADPQLEGDLRLRDGTSASSGRLEVYLGGRWGEVCDDGFGAEEGAVACRQLGYPGFVERVIPPYGSGIFLMDDVVCTGSENRLVDCRYTSEHDCKLFEQVGISCDTGAPSGEPTIAGTARVGETLSADTSSIVHADGPESPSFSYQWLADEEEIAGATGATYTLTAAEQGKRITVRVSFTDAKGNEETLTSAATEAVAAADTPLAGDLRLRDGMSASSGRLEVYRKGRWGYVCDDYFGDEEGAVACRQLGYAGLVEVLAEFGSSSDDFLMDDVACTGSENRLIDCQFRGDFHNCKAAEAVGVFCSTGVNQAPGGAPTITGTAQVGQTLTADTSSIVDGDGPASLSFSYQWLADDAAIAGATGATYTLTAAEQGKVIQVRVSYTDGGGTEETLTSAATAAVAAAAVQVHFGAARYTAVEGGAAAVVTVQLTAAPGREVTIELTATPGGGATAADYTVPGQVSFGSGETLQRFTVTATDDRVDDDGETVAAGFGELPAGVTATTPLTATVSISDDDTARVAVSAAALTVPEGGSRTYRVVLESEPAGEVTVTASVPRGTDVAVSPQRLTFTADTWSSAQRVTVRAAEDADAVADAEVAVSHAVSGYGAVTTAAAVAVTIQENDTAGVAVSAGALRVPEGGRGSYTVALESEPEGTVTVTAAVPGGTDVAVSPQRLTFTADTWSSAQRVTVRAAEDADAVADAVVTVSHAVGGYGAVSTAAAVAVTIQENDTAGVAVTPTGLTVLEGGRGSYTVALESEPAGEVTVTATVAAGTDVTVGPQRLTFTADDWSEPQAVTVSAAEDADAVADAVVTVSHAVSGYGAVTTAADVVVTVQENDTAGVVVTPTALTVPEGGRGSYTVALVTQPYGTVTVTPAVLAETALTVTPERLTFTADDWSEPQEVTLQAAADADAEVEAEVTVSHAVSGYGAVTTAAAVAVAIAELDTAGVAVTPTGLSVPEGGSGSYTVVLESEPRGEVTVTAAVSAGTDVTVSPQRLTFTAGDWSEPQEVVVQAAEDADAVADAEVTVSHEVSGYGEVTTAADVAVTVTENDTAGVMVSPTALRVPEGGSGSYAVALATQPDGTVTVTAAVSAGTDVTVSPESLTFTADDWGEPRAVEVRAAEDADAVADAEVTVSHEVSGYGAVTTAAAVTVTVQENDTAGVVVSPTALRVPEGGSGSYTVVLATRPAGTVTVTATVAAGTDVEVSPERLTFTAGDWSSPQEVTVSAAEDADAEADAVVTVSHAVSGYGAVSTAAAVQVTIAENDTAVVPRAVTVHLRAADATVSFPTNAKFTVALEFSAPVTGLALEGIEVTNGVAAQLAGGGASYTVEVTPPADFAGSLTVALAAGAAQDADGNGNAAASAEFAVDTRAPTVRSATTAPVDTGAGTTSGGVEYPEQSGSRTSARVARASEGDLQLADGDGAADGRLEIFHDNQWGLVCDDGFGDREAAVACGQLGYGGFLGFEVEVVASEETPVWLDDVSCTGSETRLVDCRHGGLGGEHNCSHIEGVRVACDPTVVEEPPRAPVAVTVTFEPPTSLRVSWEAPDNSGRPAITDYDVRYRAAGSDTYRDAAHDGTGLSTTLTNLIANTIYEVQVRASNDEGAGPWSPAVRRSTVANQAPSGQPTIMGRAQVWDTLRADVDSIMDGDGMERARFDFQWLAGEAAIAGATGGRYTLMPAEQGKRITLRVGFTDDKGHRETLTSAATAAVAAADPALAGDLRLRDGAADSSGRLEVYLGGRWGDVCDDGFGDEEGAVACRQLGYSGFVRRMVAPEYGSGVFLMDDVVCTGSENSLIDCRYARVSNCLYFEAFGISCLTGGNRVPIGEPTITGTLRVGQTLSADTSSIADANGPASPSFRYQWLADEEEIAGATGATYTLTAAEQGKRIKVRVSFTDGAGTEETLTSAATKAVNRVPSGKPTIVGTAQVWETLRADIDSIMDGDGVGSPIRFQWLADEEAIAGATGVRHTLTAAEQGKRITVRVSFTDGAGYRETLTSAATAAVAAADTQLAGNLRLRDGAAAASGRLEVYLDGRWGDVCDDGFGAEEGAVACRQLGYSGFAKRMVAPEYGSAIFLMDDVVCTGSENRLIDCRYDSEANCHWYEAVGLSCLTGVNRLPSGEPTITGTAQVGQTLSADTSSIEDLDGPARLSFSYQWLADDAAIAGATGVRYTLTLAEQGTVIQVRVSYTDGGGTEETLTSAASEAVAAADPQDEPEVLVYFGAERYTAAEGGAAAMVTVRLTTAPGREVTISLTAAPGGGATAADYTVPAQVSFGSEETLQRFTVTATDDRVDDDGETVAVGFGELPARVTASTPQTATVSIADDDTAGVAVSAGALTVPEGGSRTYRVVLESEPEGEVTVRVTVAAGTDVTVSPQRLTFEHDWSEPYEVTVSAAEDADAVADAVVTVSHEVSGYGAVSTAADVAVTIQENDTAGVAVSAGALSVPEGGSRSYTVALESEPEGTVTVTAAVPGGTDVAVSPRSLTFTADTWSSAQRVTVSAAEDADAVADAVVTVSHAVGGYGAVSTAAAVAVTIQENDTAGVVVTPTGLTVLEGGRGSYTVALESEPAGEVTVTATVAAGTDVTVGPQRLTFTADDWSEPQAVTVSAAEDADAVADAVVAVSHAVSGYGAVSTAADVAVTVQENDTAGVVVTPTALTVPEGGRGSYTVALVTQPYGTVTVTPAVPAETALTVSPERLTFTADDWSEPQEVTLQAAADADAEVEAEVTVSHAVSGYGAVTVAADVAVAIAELDTAGVTVTPTGLSVPEGGRGSYTVVLESEPRGEVTVTAAVSAGTVLPAK